MNNQANNVTGSIFTNIRSLVRATPIIGDALARIAGLGASNKFQTSKQYWEDRYKNGGNSGPGSYGRLSLFKADVVNKFSEEHGIASFAELGCGDGSQLELLNIPEYTGVDVSETIITNANRKFSHLDNRNFYILDAFKAREETFDVCMSLDVIYHLVEDPVFERHMQQLFSSATKFVIIYYSNKNDPVDDPHVRHRKFSDWIEQDASGWKLLEKIKNPYPFDWKNPRNTSFADFYIYEKVNS